MKLNEDFSELKLAASKMYGLFGFLSELWQQKNNYQTGLLQAVEFVKQNDGQVIELADNQTK